MPRPGISYLEVAQAATQLVTQNIRPSIEEVRKVLGTGSNSTINRHLRVWRDKQGHALEAQQGLPDTLLIAVKGIHEAIQEEAEHKTNAIKIEASQTITHLQTQLSEIHRLHNQLTQEKHELQHAFAQSQEEKLSLQRRLNESNHTLDNKIDENHWLQTHIDEKKTEITRLMQQFKHTQDNLEHYREAIRQEREKDQQRFDNHNQKLEQEVLHYRTQVTSFNEEVARLLAQVQWLETSKAEVEAKFNQAQLTCQNQQIELQLHRSQLQTLHNNYEILLKEHQTLAKSSTSDKETIHTLQCKLEHTEGCLETVQKALQRAEDTLAHVSDKHMFLVQEKTELVNQLKQFQATVV